VRQKRACSNSHPCGNCEAQKLPCTYPPEISNQRRRQGRTADSEGALDFLDTLDLPCSQLGSHSSMLGVEGGFSHGQLALPEAHSSELPQHDVGQESMDLEDYTSGLAAIPLDQTWQSAWPNSLDDNNENSVLTTGRDPAVHFQFLIEYARNRGLARTFEVGKSR
jgi:hypothetical protein